MNTTQPNQVQIQIDHTVLTLEPVRLCEAMLSWQNVFVFDCICKYFQIQTKYQIQIHALFVIFNSTRYTISVSKCKYKYVFGPNPVSNI